MEAVEEVVKSTEGLVSTFLFLVSIFLVFVSILRCISVFVILVSIFRSVSTPSMQCSPRLFACVEVGWGQGQAPEHIQIFERGESESQNSLFFSHLYSK